MMKTITEYPIHKGFHKVVRYEIPENLHPLINNWLDQMNPVIELGITADHVLDLLPRILFTGEPKIIAKDRLGAVVEWYYEDVIITLTYVVGNEMQSYCVQQIQVRNDNN